MASEPPAIQQADVEGVRAAAQWLLGAVGGIAVLVFAGFQISDAWQVLLVPGWRMVGTIAGAVLLLIGTLNLITAAARVLVPDRTNITDMLTRLAAKELSAHNIPTATETPGGKLEKPPEDKKANALLDHVTGEIARARGWLLPAGCDSLDDLYSAFRSTTDAAGRDRLRGNLAEVVSFARTEAALWRYRILVDRIIGWWGGGVSLAGLVLLIVCGHVELPQPLPITSPAIAAAVKVDVYFKADADLLKTHGINADCAAASQPGVLIGGTLAEPLVLVTGTQTCPQQRLLLTENLGNAVPR